jgi:hypothetical protein
MVVPLPFINAGRSWKTYPDTAKRLGRFAANVQRIVNDGKLPDGTDVAPLPRLAVHIVVSREDAPSQVRSGQVYYSAEV